MLILGNVLILGELIMSGDSNFFNISGKLSAPLTRLLRVSKKMRSFSCNSYVKYENLGLNPAKFAFHA